MPVLGTCKYHMFSLPSSSSPLPLMAILPVSTIVYRVRGEGEGGGGRGGGGLLQSGEVRGGEMLVWV